MERNSEEVIECLELREDGKIYWRERPMAHFKTKNAHSVWNARFAGKEAGGLLDRGNGYVTRKLSLSGKQYYYHIVKWFLQYGSWPDGIIDHKNQIATDNNLDNLQISNYSDNGKNRTLGSNSTTGVIGVTFTQKGDYFSYLAKGWDSIEKKWKSIICTKDFFEAICRRKAWEIRNNYSQNHGNKRLTQ